MPFKFNPFTGTLDEVGSGGGSGGDFLPLAGGTMDAGAEIAFASDSLLRQSPSGRISLAVPFDDISTFADGEYTVGQTGGINGTVNIIGGVMTVSNPGSGYTAGSAIIGGGTTITISVINGYGLDTVCAANYIHRWEGGTLYITDPFPGQRIRVAQYKLTTPPDQYQDETLGYRVGSLYILDNGNKYICTDATATAAVWIPFGANLIPTDALEYKVVGGYFSTPYISVKLNDGTVDIGEAIFGFRGDGSGGGAAFMQGPQEFRIEKNGGGLATILAEAFRVLGDFTSPSNYRQINLSMSPSGVAVLRPEGAGTGATGNELHISGLPTSNPGPGILWNNAGTPAIGT